MKIILVVILSREDGEGSPGDVASRDFGRGFFVVLQLLREAD